MKLNYCYLAIILIISNSLLAFSQKTYSELIKEPTKFIPTFNHIVNNNELPLVKNELSITLRIMITSNDINWACIFHKGISHMTTNYLSQKVFLVI